MPFPVHAGQVYLAVGPAKMQGMLDLAKKLGLYCKLSGVCYLTI